jgi:hypothetical protein
VARQPASCPHPATTEPKVQFEYTHPQTDLEKLIGGYFHINAFGAIEAGDETKFREFLARSGPPPRSTIYIDSIGGDVEAAIGIGRAIRDAWFATAIGRYVLSHGDAFAYLVRRERVAGQCLSAATLMFLGGRLRFFEEGAKFGVHQFSFKNPAPENVGQSQILSAKIAAYVFDMGISSDFLAISSSVRGGQIKLVDEEELQRLKVITGGVTDVTWSVQARSKVLYVRGERDSIFGHHKVMLLFIKGAGFTFHAVIEAQGRENELTTFPLVEIVVNGEEKKIDISNRCDRTVAGMYVNVVAELTQKEARLLAYSESFGVHIRGSKEAGMFLGIAPMDTAGGQEQLDTFFSVLSK